MEFIYCSDQTYVALQLYIVFTCPRNKKITDVDFGAG